jgi:hypothetical protein
VKGKYCPVCLKVVEGRVLFKKKILVKDLSVVEKFCLFVSKLFRCIETLR